MKGRGGARSLIVGGLVALALGAVAVSLSCGGWDDAQDLTTPLAGRGTVDPSPSATLTARPETIEDLLARPLSVPPLDPGGACPLTPARALQEDGIPYPGAGPVYLSSWSAHLPLTRWPDGRLGVKWVVRVEGPAPVGPTIIRGRRILTSTEVLFSGDANPNASSPWIELGGNGVVEAHFDSEGCYTVQFDSASGSNLLVLDIRDDAPNDVQRSTSVNNPTGSPMVVRLLNSFERPIVVDESGSRVDPSLADEGSAWTGVASVHGDRARTSLTRELCITPYGGAERCVTDNLAFDGFPSWSPDGASVVFESTRTGFRGVWLMDADGSNQRQLAPGSGVTEWFPGWSPDGSRIVFCSDRDGGWHIYTMALDGADIRQITRGPGSDWAPQFSPDGKWIGFISNREARPEAWVVRPDGTEPHRVTDTEAGWADAFAWR